jgi:hypothetical protein
MLLAGNRSLALKRWCKEFYEYRSKLAHGELEWYQKEKLFRVSKNKTDAGTPFSLIARELFVHCLTQL